MYYILMYELKSFGEIFDVKVRGWSTYTALVRNYCLVGRQVMH